jgi:hypothetical protein
MTTDDGLRAWVEDLAQRMRTWRVPADRVELIRKVAGQVSTAYTAGDDTALRAALDDLEMLGPTLAGDLDPDDPDIPLPPHVFIVLVAEPADPPGDE